MHTSLDVPSKYPLFEKIKHSKRSLFRMGRGSYSEIYGNNFKQEEPFTNKVR